jgi:proliferating cell nuclear antigen PCNA
MHVVIGKGNVEQFKNLLERVCDVNDRVNIHFREDHMYIQDMDSNHVCLFEIILKSDWFDEYNVPRETVVGVSVITFVKILKCMGKDMNKQMLKIEYEDNSDKVRVLMYGSEFTEFDKVFEMSTLDIDTELLSITEIDSDVILKMNSKILRKCVEQIGDFGETIKFECNDEWMELISEDNKETSNISIKIPMKDIDSYETTDEQLVSSYNIMYFSKMSKFAKAQASYNNVEIKIGAEVPILMTYILDVKNEEEEEETGDAVAGDNDEENEVVGEHKHSFVKLCLAPKINDDDFD